MRSKWSYPLLILLMILMLINLYLIFFYAPLEKNMGIIQKIFYFHIASAWVGFLALFIVFLASIGYLWKRRPVFDNIARASAEIGTIFITMVLVTGPLWARPIWNTWWTWDPRLTTTLVLWFMYLAYIVLQSGGEGENRQRLSAIYGIIAFINVPLVFFSIRWWRTIHPVVISSSGMNLSGKMIVTLVFSIFTFTVLYLNLLLLRTDIIKLASSINLLKEKIHEFNY